jgi:hypothetical protein
MRIEVRTPAEVSEVSRALQRANQRRLADRQADGWAERDAVRLVQRARSKADNLASRAAKADPWKGAIPEFDPPLEVRAKIMGKRFKVAGAYFQWRTDGRLLIWTADKEQSVTINLPVGPQWYEVLPAGGDRLVLLFYGYSVDVQYGSEGGISSYQKVGGAPNAIAKFDQATDFPPRDYGTPGEPDIVYPTDITLRPFPDTYTEETITETPRQTVTSLSLSDYRYSVVISKQSIHVITGWPAGLAGLLSQKYEIATAVKVVNTTPKVRITEVLEFAQWTAMYNNETDYHSEVYRSIVDVLTGAYNEDYEVVLTPNAYQSPTLLQYNTGGEDVFIAFVWHPLMRSYGYGHLVNRDADGQTPGWGWTPAVFSFLKNYAGEFHKEDGDTSMLTKALSYQHARDNYIPLDAPPYFLTADVTIPDAEGDTTKTYYYFRAPAYDIPLDYSNPLTFRTEGNTIAPVTLRPNRGEYTTEVIRPLATSQRSIEISELAWTSYEIPVAAWDWDRPLACWIELIRLGFTPDDLMLSEEEQQALSEADPAEAGFKF